MPIVGQHSVGKSPGKPGLKGNIGAASDQRSNVPWLLKNLGALKLFLLCGFQIRVVYPSIYIIILPPREKKTTRSVLEPQISFRLTLSLDGSPAFRYRLIEKKHIHPDDHSHMLHAAGISTNVSAKDHPVLLGY